MLHYKGALHIKSSLGNISGSSFPKTTVNSLSKVVIIGVGISHS
jgi:hypothetical protein